MAASPQPRQRGAWGQILLFMLGGIGMGIAFPTYAMRLGFLGDMFIALMKMVITPLVFVIVVQGIASATAMKGVGRVWWRSLIYFEVVSTLALILGMLAGNVLKLGEGLEITSSSYSGGASLHEVPNSPMLFLQQAIPSNLMEAFSGGNLPQVLVLAVLTGFAVLALPHDSRSRIVSGFDLASELVFSAINLILKFAPIGAFGAMAFTIAKNGTGALFSLGEFVASFYATVALFIVGVLGMVAWFTGLNFWRFLAHIREEMILVFAVASSESALPRLTEKLMALGCDRQTVRLVLPIGYSFNLDGSSIYMAMGLMFVSHASGVPLSWVQQLGLLALMAITSKGAAAVHGSSFIVLSATITASGLLPMDSMALLFGVHALLTRGIALCNAIGNAVATFAVSRWTDTLDSQVARGLLEK
jgi:aerobic C4-dicarboxylate transport protein